MDTLVGPLQEKMEEWKKTVVQLDKDHAKGELIYCRFSDQTTHQLFHSTGMTSLCFFSSLDL